MYFICLLFILFITIYLFIVSVSRDFGCYTKVSPPALEGIWSQFSKHLWNECMIVGISESESVSWGLQEELMRQGEGDLAFLLLLPSLLWLLTSSWWSGCSLIYWWRPGSASDSPLPPSARRARFRCATLCSKLLITTNGNRSSPRVNWKL